MGEHDSIRASEVWFRRNLRNGTSLLRHLNVSHSSSSCDAKDADLIFADFGFFVRRDNVIFFVYNNPSNLQVFFDRNNKYRFENMNTGLNVLPFVLHLTQTLCKT